LSWYIRLSSIAGLLLVLAGLVGTAARTPSTPNEAAPEVAGPPPEPVAPAAPVAVQQAPAAPTPTGPRVPSLAEAEQARRNGDFDGALTILRLLRESPDPAIAVEAQLQVGLVLGEAGRSAEAIGTLQELLGRQLDQPARARATFVLGRAQRIAGDCQAALSSFGEAQRLGFALGPNVDLQMAACHAAINDRAGQADRASRAVASATSRLSRIDALEYQVDAALKQGQQTAALGPSEQLLQAAGTRVYRAKTQTSIGNILAGLDRRADAAQAFAAVLNELPEAPSAASALEGLAALGSLDSVAPDQVGLVHHFQGRHADAVAALGRALGRGLPADRAASAMFYQGLSLGRLGRVDDAVSTFKQVTAVAPDSAFAPRALLRAGRSLEDERRLEEAGELYRQAAQSYPSSAAGQEAHARLVVTLHFRGAWPEAVAAGRDLAAGGADPRWKGLGLLWAGKALARAGDGPQAETLWRQASDVDLDEPGGLRARALLSGDDQAVQSAAPLDPARLRPSEGEQRELASWLARYGTDPSTLEAEQRSDAAYALAGELYGVGLREQGGWELQEVSARVGKDPARLFWLARYADERGDTLLSILFATQAREATGEPLHAQPRLLQRLIYPLPYGDLIAANANERGVDPLLLAALIRQESTFKPDARSSADAMGLAQIVPATGHGIARALGRADFRTDYLFRPIVAFEFGTYYLANQLREYQGKIYPALAAYNAGGGAVNRWLREPANDDPDIFAERIPYAETSTYVNAVFQNYQIYRRLYGE
jgi:soluble lytic murein transglycosylase